MYINQGKKQGKRAAVKKDFNLGREAYFGFHVREGVPPYSKNIGDGPIK
jgi:hypothetical protein